MLKRLLGERLRLQINRTWSSWPLKTRLPRRDICNKINSDKQYNTLGRGNQVVSVLAFYSDDPSSNPAEAYSFSVKICV